MHTKCLPTCFRLGQQDDRRRTPKAKMQPNEHLKRVMKILIFAFLCTEMRTSKLILGEKGINEEVIPVVSLSL